MSGKDERKRSGCHRMKLKCMPTGRRPLSFAEPGHALPQVSSLPFLISRLLSSFLRSPLPMPSHSPNELAARPAQRSLVLVQPTGLLVSMTLVLGSLLLLINGLKLVDNPTLGRKVAGVLLGLGVLGAGYRRARGNRPRLLRFDREALHLGPLGHQPGPPTETIPLRSIVAYTYWLRLRRWQVFAQCHLRLELADGRMLYLADRPGTRPDDPTGTVRLDVLAKRLARRAKSRSGLLRRPLFFQTRTAQALLWASGGALALGGGLLGLGHDTGLLLLPPSITYACLYYLGRANADFGQ